MYIYGVFEGYIQQYSAVTVVFFIRRKKNPEGMFLPRTTKTEVEAAM